MTITAHKVNSDWEMGNVVLQTDTFESHTGANFYEHLTDSLRPNHGINIVTENVHNMEEAAREAGLEPHMKCFAHTINLATQGGLCVARLTCLLWWVRRHSSTATAVSKQKLLQLPSHKLIMNITMQWNSASDMLDHYLRRDKTKCLNHLYTGQLRYQRYRRQCEAAESLEGSHHSRM